MNMKMETKIKPTRLARREKVDVRKGMAMSPESMGGSKIRPDALQASSRPWPGTRTRTIGDDRSSDGVRTAGTSSFVASS